MTDPTNRPEATPAGSFEFNRPTIVAALYLASAVTVGLAAVIGLVLAYVWKGEAHQSWEATHYTYLIRTFWIALIASFAAVILTIITFGLLAPLFGLIGIWAIVRAIISLIKAQRRAPIPDPRTLLF